MTATTDEKLASAADAKLAVTDEVKSLSKEERLALIRVNLAEVLNPEILENVINEGCDPRIYWGRLSDCCIKGIPANSHDRQEPPQLVSTRSLPLRRKICMN
jgi:hypothetical protein